MSTPTSGSAAPGPIRRLGVMGGSFDPIHLAHLIVAESVREALDLDLVLFMPVGLQPLKASSPVASAEHRVAMVRLAIEGNTHFALSRVDVDHPGPSYTVGSLERLRREWGGPDLQMWFIIGADSLATFPTWHDPVGILGQCRLAVVGRPGVQVNLSSINAQLPQLEQALDWVEAPLIGISATELRGRISRGLTVRYRVAEPVREYILANRLYL